MESMWLYALCQCMASVSVIVVSVRSCMAVSGGGGEASTQERIGRAPIQPGSVSWCLRLCLGLVGALGGAVGVPVTILINLRTSQCLYTCITLVCCPMLVRHFTMFLVMLLTVDDHLQLHLPHRYSSIVTRQRALCVVLLCWVASVLSSFAHFIGLDLPNAWRRGGTGPGTAGLGLQDNWTTSLPPKYHHDLKEIGQHLPYGGFLSKFYVEDMKNFTYAEIHGSHWGVCAPDTILSPEFLVYVHGTTVFVLPLLCLLLLYLNLLCVKPRKTPLTHVNGNSPQVRSLTSSLSLLVLLCSPLHVVHALLLYTPSTKVPTWAHAVASLLSQVYGLVPQILFTPPKRQMGGEQPSFPVSVPHLPPAFAQSRGKSVQKALCEAVQAAPWSSAKNSLKAKVCPEV